MTAVQQANALATALHIETICELHLQGVTDVTDALVEETLDLVGQGLSIKSAARLVRADWANGLIS